MKRNTLKDAIEDAERFIKLATECLSEPHDGVWVWINPGKLSGAVRRSSMDLTRKLADLRQNRG